MEMIAIIEDGTISSRLPEKPLSWLKNGGGARIRGKSRHGSNLTRYSDSNHPPSLRR